MGSVSGEGKTLAIREQVVRKVKELEILHSVGKLITSLLDLDELLARIVEASVDITRAEEGYLLLVDEGTGELYLRAGQNLGEEHAQGFRLKVHDTIAGSVVKTGKPVMVTSKEERGLKIKTDYMVKSLLNVPLKVREKVVGVLGVNNKVSDKAFSEDNLHMLSILADYAAIAIEYAQLFSQLSETKERLRALIQVSQAITDTLELDEVTRRVMNSVVAAFPMAQRGTLYLYDEQADVLRLQANTYGYSPAAVEAVRLKPGEGISGWVFQQGQPTVVYDAQHDYRYKRIDHPEVPVHKSMICVPLKRRERVIGTMSLDNSDIAGAFRDDDLELLSIFSDQVAIAIDNAYLYRETHRRGQLLAALDEASRHIRAERETSKILHEVVRLAAQLVGCAAGALFINRPHLEELELQAAYGPCTELVGSRLPHASGLAGLVARTGKPQMVLGYSDWPDREAIFEPYNFETVAGIPLEHAGIVEAVLLVADNTGSQRLLQADLEILERFATQAAIALQTSQLVGREQRMFSQLDILHRISDYIQAAKDLDKILHAVLTSLTAGYGLGFNRAALLLLDERRECLVGRMGIGHLEEPEARRDWAQHHEHRLENFQRYLELLDRNGLPLTPVGERIRKVRLPATLTNDDLFWEIVREQQCALVTPDELQRLPEGFVKAFEPALPMAIVPLTARGQAIGLLVVDNKFTQSPITPEDIEALMTFAYTAAVAIENTQLYHGSVRRIKESEHMHQAAEALAGVASLPEVLHQIVRSAREVLQADSAAIWSYDDVRDKFIPESSVASGIPAELWQESRQEEPRRGRTAYTIMEQGWIAVSDVADTERYGFLGEGTRRLLDQTGVQSFQGIALMVGDEKLGVLYVNYNNPHSFHEKEQEIARTFANHAALALKKARLLEQVRKARDAARVVAEVTVLEDLHSTLDSIVRGTQDALGCDAVTLYTYEQVKEKVGYPPVMVGIRYPESVARFSETPKHSLVFEMLQRDESYVADEITTDPLFSGRRFAVDEGIKSCVAIPLKVRDYKVGVMFVNYRAYHHFTTDELTNLELFANQAAVAIRNAQLYNETNERAAILQTLYEAGKVVTSSLALDEILSRIAKQALNVAIPRGPLTHFSHLALVEGKRVRFVAASPSEILAELKEKVGDIDLESSHIGTIGRVVRTGISQNIGYAARDPNYVPVRPSTCSQLTVPIKVGDRVFGLINVEHSECNAFDKEDQQALEHLAAQAAIAIQNARQYEELKRTKGLVGARTALAWIGMTGSIWRHAVETYALTIREQTQLLQRELQRSLSREDYAKMDERLGMIERLTTKILEKPITPPLSGEEGVTLVVVDDLIGERARQLWQSEPYKSAELQLDLRLDKAATVWVSPEWLRRAFDILVDNAVEAVAGCEVREITIGTRRVDEGAEIVVSDTGPGMPEGVLLKLFQEPIERPEDAKGLGMGLLMARTIIQTYGGDIRVEFTSPTGTTMVIWLPLAAEEAK